MTNKYRELAERIIIKFDLSLDDMDDLIEVIRSWGEPLPEPEPPTSPPDLAAGERAKLIYYLNQINLALAPAANEWRN